MHYINNSLKYPTIGLIDSGIGGLHLLKALYETIPAHYIYRADSANMPYGTKSNEEIIKLGIKSLNKIATYNPDCIIIACHTLSSLLPLSELSSSLKIPLIGIIDLVTKAAYDSTRNKHIGIIATSATITSGAHQKALLQYDSSIICTNRACPTLASAIENDPHDPQLFTVVQNYLKHFQSHNIDTLILGCTHYEAVSSLIKQIMGPQITLIEASATISDAVKTILQFKPSALPLSSTSSIKLITTGDLIQFKQSAGKAIPQITDYKLEKES